MAVLRLGLIASIAATVLTLTARGFWVGELCCHFRIQLVGMLAALLLCSLLSRQWKLSLLIVVLAAYHGWMFAGDFFRPHTEYRGTRPIRLLSLNVLTSNHQAHQVLELIESAQPDVIVLSEVDRWWIDELAVLVKKYPYFKAAPRSDNFGMAIYSRLAWTDVQIESLAPTDVPVIIATIRHQQQTLQVIGAHVFPPVTAQTAQRRNQQLASLAAIAAEKTGATVMLGDLNITPWSPFFADLIRQSKLRDSRKGFGIQSTWPADNYLLRIPIDHALVSNEVVVLDRWTGPDVGSDHLPVLLEIGIRQ